VRLVPALRSGATPGATLRFRLVWQHPRSMVWAAWHREGGRRTPDDDYPQACASRRTRDRGRRPGPAHLRRALIVQSDDLGSFRLLEPRTLPPRSPHPRSHPRRHRLRCPRGENEMSRNCRPISVTVPRFS
jgi:hypothetical protein